MNVSFGGTYIPNVTQPPSLPKSRMFPLHQCRPHTLSSFSYFSLKCSPRKINILSLSLPSLYISNKCCTIYGLYVVSLLWHAFKVTHTVTLINILYIPHVSNLLLLCAGLFPPFHLCEHEQTVNYLFLFPIAVV